LNRKITPIVTSEWQPDVYDKEMAAIKGLNEAIKEYKENTKSVEAQSRSYPEVVFFGTGSAIPGKLRNSTCILVNTDAENSIMLDCGEGSFGQIYRYYGEDRYKTILRNLKSIFTSHMHADHHIGLITFLKERERFFGNDVQPVQLFSGEIIYKFLNDWDQSFEPISHLYTYYDNPRVGTMELPSVIAEQCGLQKIELAKVRHCRQSCGIALTTKKTENAESYKIVFSGDAMPSETLVEIGKDCDLLIHEATLDDVFSADALLKHHSTTSQAIEIGNEMKAKYTLLTHFSQRYSKLPHINELFDHRIGIAFDNMSIRLTDMEKMHHLVKVMKVFFAEEVKELNEKIDKLVKQKQVLSSLLEK
jgi:ribonuclease Z